MSWGEEKFEESLCDPLGMGQTGRRDHSRFSAKEIGMRLGVEVD